MYEFEELKVGDRVGILPGGMGVLRLATAVKVARVTKTSITTSDGRRWNRRSGWLWGTTGGYYPTRLIPIDEVADHNYMRQEQAVRRELRERIKELIVATGTGMVIDTDVLTQCVELLEAELEKNHANDHD